MLRLTPCSRVLFTINENINNDDDDSDDGTRAFVCYYNGYIIYYIYIYTDNSYKKIFYFLLKINPTQTDPECVCVSKSSPSER